MGLDWLHRTSGAFEVALAAFDTYNIGFCYDLIPAMFPEWVYPPDPDGLRRHMAASLHATDHTMCISRWTESDLVRLFLGAAGRTSVSHSADLMPMPSDSATTFARGIASAAPFAVYCATIDRRKNHQLLYRVMRQMVDRNYPGNLVLVGKIGAGVADSIDLMRHDPVVRGRVWHVSNCDDDHLSAVYPSLYEGWGQGVTESLASGTPCLIADNSSLPEVGLGVCSALDARDTLEWLEATNQYF